MKFKSGPFKRNERKKECLNDNYCNSLLNEENVRCEVLPSFIDVSALFWSNNKMKFKVKSGLQLNLPLPTPRPGGYIDITDSEYIF
jgi:hypothetical protein